MSRQPTERAQAIVQGDAQGSGDVVVAGAGGAKMNGSRRREVRDALASASEDAETFDEAGDVGSVEAVIPVLALSREFEEMERGEALKVNAGGGRADFGDKGEFGAGAGVSIHKRAKHAGAGGFGDGGGDAGDGGVERRRRVGCDGRSGSDVHCLMIDEG